ncbi:MAG: hypothetical protein Hals2KO_38440 [Halioglobus sp.]
MNPSRVTTCLLLSLACSTASAQSGEALEISPEARDAAWTSADAAREAALFSNTASGTARTSLTLSDGAAATDLVFSGRVTAQSYVYDNAGRPFTHTTVRIDTILKGSYAGPEITLVQEGGPEKDSADNIVLVSDAQYFAVGEEELLFVDLDLANPVATQRVAVRQRFRIYSGKVFGVDGHGVLLQSSARSAGQTISWSNDRHPAARFSQFQIGKHTLTRHFTDSAAQSTAGPGSPQARAAAPGYQSSVDVDTFSASISAAVAAGSGD